MCHDRGLVAFIMVMQRVIYYHGYVITVSFLVVSVVIIGVVSSIQPDYGWYWCYIYWIRGATILWTATSNCQQYFILWKPLKRFYPLSLQLLIVTIYYRFVVKISVNWLEVDAFIWWLPLVNLWMHFPFDFYNETERLGLIFWFRNFDLQIIFTSFKQ